MYLTRKTDYHNDYEIEIHRNHCSICTIDIALRANNAYLDPKNGVQY
jgi:hypothetical protein